MPQSRRTIMGANKLAQLVDGLSSANSAHEIFQKSAEILLDPNLLNCEGATFYTPANGAYKVAYTTGRASSPLDPKKRASLAGLLDGNAPYLPIGKRELLLPIRANKRTTGLLRLRCQARSCLLNGKSQSTLGRTKWLMLHAVNNIIASSLDNFRIRQKLKRQSIIDPLTRVYNRGHFDRQGKLELMRAKRYNKKIAYILIDLDNLKHINDKFGHIEGDQVLRAVGRILKRNCRQIDLVCRYGGDEFVVVLQETSRKDAMRKAETLRRQIYDLTAKSTAGKNGVLVSTSIGVATLNDDYDSHTALFRAADQALYKAKLSGKNCCRCYK